MKFCEENTTAYPLFAEYGVSLCLFDSVFPAALLLLMVIGLVNFARSFKYGQHVDRDLKAWSCLCGLHFVLVVFFIVESIARFTVRVSFYDERFPGYLILCAVSGCLSWVACLLLLYNDRTYVYMNVPRSSHGPILLIYWSLAFAKENLSLVSWRSHEWWWGLNDRNSYIEFGFWCARYISSFGLFILGFIAPVKPRRHSVSEEGALPVDESTTTSGQRSTWYGVTKKLVKLWPYMWPKKHYMLQFRVVFCFLLLVAGRLVNLLTPIYYKEIVNSLSYTPSTNTVNLTESVQRLVYRYDLILMYALLRFLNGGGIGSMGFLNNLRTFLWIRVEQYTSKGVSLSLFAHLHDLSLRWHLARKTGEVLRIMDRGTTSITSLLNYLVFQIIPTLFDIVIAVVYFVSAFNIWFGLIVFTTMLLYIVATVIVTEWRTKYRREMNTFDNNRNAKGVDSLLNFETVKYYNGSGFEAGQYEMAIDDFQGAEWKAVASLNLLNSIQNVIINCGLLGGTLLCAWYVVDQKGLTVGDYVLFASYVIQLYAPLNWFGTYFRMIQQAFIDMENMFDLLAEKKEIEDCPCAPAIRPKKGMIEFDNVCFEYNPVKPVLRNVTFSIPPGETYALVGPSGVGKSTIIRLLFRFYDISSGAIYIDGQDISTVTQKSLRQIIGVVPQDTVLFNADIRYNIRYGRFDASDKEIEDAADAADIHERILTFPDGYSTRVGERGLKLSGGEKQRVAIARTILKSPLIVLLDEATSALDTETERNIQSSLMSICENRTTLIVAHRLSTIIHSHQIMVLKDGVITEKGSHEELLARKGTYAKMWKQQLSKAQQETSDFEPDDSSLKSGPVENLGQSTTNGSNDPCC